MMPLMDSAGETKVWEHELQGDSGKKISVPGVILVVAGLVLCVLGVLPALLAAGQEGFSYENLQGAGFTLGGAVLMLIAGILFGRSRVRKGKDRQIEIHIDAGKVYRSFRTAILSIDQSLEEIRAAERWSKREQAGTIDGRKVATPEIDLFAGLLAASYSQDPEYALEKIDEIKYYLHRQQIEVVDYSEETRQYFDLMPGTEAGTIRPALVADGAVLKKGLASAGK